MASPVSDGILTGRFDDAFLYARRLHAEQRRKGTRVPYVAHLLAVASLVLEVGGDENEAIAALLHDAVEDQGGEPVLEEIRRRFGGRVADIVAGCTDAWEEPKPPWRERKEAYIAHLGQASPSVLLVSCADKLHNVRSLIFDYGLVGDELWARFNAGRDDILWYYGALAERFVECATGATERLAEELDMAVSELEGMTLFKEDMGQQLVVPVRSTRTGRNEPCPCGSGRKYQKCCGARRSGPAGE